jgi:hypothetical protein
MQLADESIADVLAFWPLNPVPDEAVPTVLSGVGRILRPVAVRPLQNRLGLG